MKKQSKKIITMLLVFMFAFAVPSTMVMAVPKKSGVDKTLSAKWLKKTHTNYYYKGEKKKTLDALVTKWSQGKISEKSLKKKIYAMKWKEKSFVPSNLGTHPVILI